MILTVRWTVTPKLRQDGNALGNVLISRGPGRSTIELSDVPLNARTPIAVTDDGISINVSLVLRNASWPIVSKPSTKLTLLSSSQSLNARSPTIVTVEGIDTDAMLVPIRAASPMLAKLGEPVSESAMMFPHRE